ncbi:MAG: hypothetical protein A3G75_08385 [Verrucomicrobia bacterium RIFCSPLOWO2_12_FULL_64_8]|nr:MAG: hypothetical protein A3G75_08385 [Verrucomicrobia bacterium RIFCSPLOWO2_12_FULL_64_8]
MNPGDDSFLSKLTEIFFAGSNQRFCEIEQAIAGSDPGRAVRQAHGLKGSSSIFGATRLTKISADLEPTVKQCPAADAVSRLPARKEEFARVRAGRGTLLPAGQWAAGPGAPNKGGPFRGRL